MWLSLTDFTSRRSPLEAGGGSAEGSSCRWCRSCRWLWSRSTRWAVSMTTALVRLSVAMASSSSSSSPASQASLVLLSNSWKVLPRLAFTGVVGALDVALSKLQSKGSLYRTPQPPEASPRNQAEGSPRVKRCTRHGCCSFGDRDGREPPRALLSSLPWNGQCVRGHSILVSHSGLGLTGAVAGASTVSHPHACGPPRQQLERAGCRPWGYKRLTQDPHRGTQDDTAAPTPTPTTTCPVTSSCSSLAEEQSRAAGR